LYFSGISIETPSSSAVGSKKMVRQTADPVVA